MYTTYILENRVVIVSKVLGQGSVAFPENSFSFQLYQNEIQTHAKVFLRYWITFLSLLHSSVEGEGEDTLNVHWDMDGREIKSVFKMFRKNNTSKMKKHVSNQIFFPSSITITNCPLHKLMVLNNDTNITHHRFKIIPWP